jgi:hypothetical protein
MTQRTKEWMQASAGLVAAPSIWAVNMQLGQILPYLQCSQGTPLLLIVSLAGLLAAGFATMLSWRVTANGPSLRPESASVRTFVATLSGLLGAVFLFALALQVIASMVLTGCER